MVRSIGVTTCTKATTCRSERQPSPSSLLGLITKCSCEVRSSSSSAGGGNEAGEARRQSSSSFPSLLLRPFVQLTGCHFDKCSIVMGLEDLAALPSSLSLSLSLAPTPTRTNRHDRRRLSLSLLLPRSVAVVHVTVSIGHWTARFARGTSFSRSWARARTQHRPGRRILTFELTLCAASNRERASRSRSPFPYFWPRLREFRSPRPEGAGRRDSLNLPIALGLLLPICSSVRLRSPRHTSSP